MTAVLVETGFMTNPSDVSLLSDPAMQRRIAGSIVEGLREYIEGNGRRSAEVDENRNQPFSVIGVSEPPVSASGISRTH